MNTDNPLLRLRAAHAPADISWWPPAIGWWLVVTVLIALMVFISIRLYRRYRRQAYKREALHEWSLIKQHYESIQDSHYLINALSNLLKRTCISRYGRSSTAGLTSQAWLAFLDRTGKTEAFSQGPGQALVTERYQKQPTVDAQSLLTTTRRWLEAQQ